MADGVASWAKGLIDRRVVRPLLFGDGVGSYLGFWAKLVLRARKPIIVGITGTSGKTTTTDMIAAVLTHPRARPALGRVEWTRHNMNDDVGVPATILLFKDKTPRRPLPRLGRLLGVPLRAVRLALSKDYPRVLVLEMGTHWRGHLHRIAQLAPPRVGVVTTIGPGHLERLKTIDGVVEEKGAIVKWTDPSGLVILGTDHDRVEALRSRARAPIVTVDGRGVESSRNIARAVGRYFGVPGEAVEEALGRFRMPPGRLNRVEIGDLTVIDDSFNANPSSMRLALDTLADTCPPGRRRVAILGAMAELGGESARYHRDVGEYARGRCDVLIGVGQAARDYGADHWFADSEACARAAPGFVSAGDCLLIKGSASVKMARVVEKLRDGVGREAVPEPSVEQA